MKILYKCFFLVIVLAIFISGLGKVVEGKEDEYLLANVAGGSAVSIETFDDFYKANNAYLNSVDEYDNLVLFHNDKVIKMEYGVVEFKSDEACSLTIDYHSNKRNENDVLNGCYGADGAYLYTDNKGEFVHFIIGGDVGYASIDDVTLRPYELLNNGLSTYKNIGDDLYHKIKLDLDSDYYGKVISIDKAYPLFEEDKDYYCYDNHYFYDDFKLMIDDYNNDTRNNAINSDKPYYNYYEYISFRTLTNYDYLELESYFNDTLMIEGKLQSYDDQAKDKANDVVNRSQYYGELKSFYENQYIYGANALLSLAVSINDTAYGKSLDSYLYNQLFNKLAFRINEDNETRRYKTLGDSIKAFDKYYISNKYSNHLSLNYKGNFLGDKASGINVDYSSNPYWSQEVSSNYYSIDKALGFKDYNSYSFGIIKKANTLNFYNEKELHSLKFSIKNVTDYSLIILEENDNSYKVQIDPSFKDDYVYSFDESIAYINKQVIDHIFNQESIHQNKMVNITFKAEGGTIDGKSEISIPILKGQTPVISDPIYDGYKFVGFDQELVASNYAKTYKAIYKEIKELKLNKGFDKTIEQNQAIDLSNNKLIVNYTDGSGDILELDSNMLDKCIFEKDGKQNIRISYCGKTIDVEVNVSQGLKQLREELNLRIINNINSFKKNGTYSSDDLLFIKKNINEINYDFDINDLRLIDEMLSNQYKEIVNYRIEDNDYDLSLSGLALSLVKIDSKKHEELPNDTYYISALDIESSDKEKLTNIGKAYGFEAQFFFKLSYMLNMSSIEQNGPMIVSIRIPNKELNNIYTVYRLDNDGNIIKCLTTQTDNRIQFLTKKAGNFVVLTKQGVNSFNIPNYYENMAPANSAPDSRILFVSGWLLVALLVLGTAFIVFNLSTEGKKKILWKDYKKSLQKAEYVPEEKQKN